MIVKSLRLVHYRNYADETFDFSPGINVIRGKNAQGKTNLVESIYLLSRGYTHKAGTLQDLIGFNEAGFFVQGTVCRQETTHRLEFKLSGKKKEVLIDGKKDPGRERTSRALSTILFEPDDLKIVKEGPEKRRRFMNTELSGFKPNYSHVLKGYTKILNQRNALLKEIRYDKALKPTLALWDEQLVKSGASLMRYRVAYLHSLNQKARALHKKLSGDLEALTLFYQNNVLEHIGELERIEAIFTEKLRASYEEDIHRGSTTYGPHVDDIAIHLNGVDAKKYGSQGQQRTAAIALKLSQIEIYKENTGDYPVVLLDDILSELDARRQENILSILGNTQAFITCTDSSFIENFKGLPLRRIDIQGGRRLGAPCDLK
ncbi:MAG: DNA replication/repair protein RecF [Eubacterium sp.]|nr:DNA replication/repair protein RecF [Eubacterium sp.]